MIIFLDENDVEYGALATIKATNAVNGERSITGEIISGDVVLSRIERGWRLRFEDEYYVVTYAKPIDEGKNVQVSFDAVHQFFWDFGKSSVYDQLSDGSHTFRAYLDFIFDRSGYTYDIETSLMVKAFEKQSFGYKNRLSLFNDVITSSGVEFQVNGKVVRILVKVGTDLSTVVRKNFNLNELGIEKNIGDFVTYQKGFGAYFDEEDHSKGRLIAEYTSPLASVYGKLEADPLVDERYKQPESLLNALKNTVDNSYTISVSLDMEDLTRAGYRYTQPVAGDYIMAINETLGFKEKIRIVSFTSEYDVAGQLIKHTVTCNDIGSVKKLSASYTQTQHQAANAEVNANTAYEFANKALVSANGKNTNYYGDAFPVDNPKGTLKKGDLLFLTVGDTVKQYYWNGAEWVTNPVVSDVEAFKEQIAEELKDVPNREEFENKISEEIANSKAEIETQIETAKTQAESNAKEYADTINQETVKVAEQAKTAADEIKADLVNVKSNLTATSLVANNAQSAVDEAKQDLTKVASELDTAKQDLTSHAQQLQMQANAQTELTKRVTTVETTANGTKTTVNELTKTVAQNGKDITSVTAQTKTVEDDLANTKTTLTQVQTTANSTSQKTATLETGLNGVKADLTATTTTANTTKQNLASYQASNDKAVANLQSNIQTANGNISSLQTKVEAVPGQITSAVSAVESKIPKSVGSVNLFKGSRDFRGTDWINNYNGVYAEDYQGVKIYKTQDMWSGRSQYFEVKTGEEYVFSAYVKSSAKTDNVGFYLTHSSKQPVATGLVSFGSVSNQDSVYFELTDNYKRIAIKIKITKDGWIMPRLERSNSDAYLFFGGYKLERGIIATDWSPAPEDYDSDITKLNTTLTQTANGLEQLSTQVTSQGSTIISHTNSINSLTTGLSAKVSQSDFNTLSGRVTTAENNIIAKANELSSKITSVEGKIPASVSQRNLIRGTSDSWSPFVDITTKNNWLWDLATVRYGDNTGIYPNTTINIFVYLSADNIVLDSSVSPRFFIQGTIINKNGDETWTDWDKYHPFHNKWSTNLGAGNNYRIVKISSKVTSESYSNINGFKIGVRIDGVQSGKFHYRALMVTTGDVFPDYWQPAPEDYDSKLATVQSEIKQTTDSIKASVQSLDNNTVKNSSLTINTDGVVIKAGKSTSDFANAIGSYFSVNQNAINLFSDKINVKGNMIVSGAITSDKIASKQINTAHLNGKIITADVISSNAVTADAIKAGAVTTDKMSANSINGDRITAGTLDAAKIKAGSISASQIASGTLTSEQIKAGAIKSINIEASAITSDKIASNSIDASKIVTNGLTANIIKGGKLQSISNATNFELDTGKLFYNNNNTGVFRVQSGASTMGLKFTNTAITVNSSSKVLSRVILGGDRRESTLDDGKWDQGGFTGIVVETINGVASNAHDKADTLRAIGDNIYFTHSYETDTLTGVSAAGWKMETYAPGTSYKGNVVLKPYGVSYRQSNIVVGDLRLDNGDGSGYWMRATINVLKACFGHIVNGGVSGDALNAIKSELNKISGT